MEKQKDLIVCSDKELKEKGITFDYALPQAFYNNLLELTELNPMGNIVYGYPKRSIVYGYPKELGFGWPIAITEAGANMLAAFDKEYGTSYAEGLPKRGGV